MDVDYFALLDVEKRIVNFGPTSGNIVVGVGPAAIETGLVPAAEGEPKFVIHAVNTGARVEELVQNPV